MLIFTTITFAKENNPMQIEISAMKGVPSCQVVAVKNKPNHKQ